jgi:PIN domain nuclease of toxin-antitoxin system
MNLILDTHVFLWYLQDDDQLTPPIANILESTENKLYLSIASLWEIAIKLGIGKLELEYSFDDLQDALNQFDIQILPIEFPDTRQYLDLPLHHRDPFDRILVSQSLRHGFTLVSRDAVLDAYNIDRLWIN